MFSIILLLIIIFLAYKASPREKKEHAHIHGAGQIGLLAAVALFGVDYFTSYYYATGEMMSALHPYGLQDKAYFAVGVIAFANFAFGLLYMFSLGQFNEGGGSYTASMRYLWPTLSLIVAVALIQDYVLTIVVSALSGGDQLLSILGLYGRSWLLNFALGAMLAAVTWYLTIRGRGESARVVFGLIGVFGLLSVTMGVGLLLAHLLGVPPVPPDAAPRAVSLGQAMLHMLTASMKGMVALNRVGGGGGEGGLFFLLLMFGVDYFTSYYYATGEMMSALHPYGLQDKAYLAVAVIAFANFAFGLLYMFSLGPFNEGGGSYTASMRYLWPTLSLIVAVALIQDYVLTIVVSALSGGDQLLSILGLYGRSWLLNFALGALLAAVTWYLTIRGRGESARVVFGLIGVFAFLTVTLGVGLLIAHFRGVRPVPQEEAPQAVSLGQAMLHLLTAAMKGMVALTGLEAVSNGIQFMQDEDASIVKWGKRRLQRLNWLWNFYSGKSGIGRFVQTSFLFYGGLTTLFLAIFAIRFNMFDGTFGRTLVGNLAFVGFNEIPGGMILFWAYQIVAVMM